MVEEIIEGTHPTRMELLTIKRKIRLAEKGHHLLRDKLDALMMELTKVMEKSKAICEEANEKLEDARGKLAIARAWAGASTLSSTALVTIRELKLEGGWKNVMGVKVPTFSISELERRVDERGYSLTFTPPLIDEVAKAFESLLSSLIKLAEVQYTLSILGEEIERTRRRVNALENRVIPRLKNTHRYIQLRLDELERENFYRLKEVKKKKGWGEETTFSTSTSYLPSQ